MAHLSMEEKLEYTKLFLKVNEEFGKGDGAMGIAEFEKFLILCGFKLPREIVALKFAENDTDGNWKITLDEFLAKMPNIAPTGSVLSMAANIRRKYSELDITKDGFISYDELKTVMSQKGDVTEEFLQNFMKEWDIDGDGRINFEEFVIVYTKTALFGENRSNISKEQEKIAEQLTELVLSSDKLLRLANERDLVKDGLISEDDLKALMSEVKIQISDEQFRQCIKNLDGDSTGKVPLEDFVNMYEDVVIKQVDDAKKDGQQLTSENNSETKENEDKREKGTNCSSCSNEDTESKETSNKNSDKIDNEISKGDESKKDEQSSTDKPRPGVKGMVGKFENMKL